MSVLVDLHRQKYPSDPRSDAEIVEAYHDADPVGFAQIPGAIQDYARIQLSKSAQGPEPEGALMTGLREFGEAVVPAAGAGLGAAGAGALAVETGPGAIPAAVAGGTAGGAAGEYIKEKAKEAFLGKEGVEQLRAQEQANREAHPIAAKVGQFIGQVPAMLGGKGLAKAAGLTEGTAANVLENAAAGGIMSGGSAAAEKVDGNQDVSIPGEIVKGAVTMGPLGFLPAAKSVLGAMGWKAPADAVALGLNNALYDHFVRGTPIDPKGLAEQIGTDVPGFVLMNALTGVLHLPFFPNRDGKIDSVKTAPSTEPAPTPEPPAIKPGADYHLSDEQKGVLSGLAGKVMQGDESPEVQKAIHRNTDLMDGVPNEIRVEAQTYFEGQLQRIATERAAAASEQARKEQDAQRIETPTQPHGYEQQPEGTSQAKSGGQEAGPDVSSQGVPERGQGKVVPQPAENVPPVAQEAPPAAALPPAESRNPNIGITEPKPTPAAPESVSAPTPAPENDPVEKLLAMVGFGNAQLIDKGKSERGQKNAAAFVENPTREQLYTDQKDGRKMGVFTTPDGKVMVAHVFKAVGRGKQLEDFVTGLDGKRIRFDDLAAQGYKLIVALKGEKSTRTMGERFAATYSPEVWDRAAQSMRDMHRAALGTAEAMQEHLHQAGLENRTEGEGASDLEHKLQGLINADDVAEGVAPAVETELKGFTQEHAEGIWGAIKGIPTEDKAKWEQGFVQAVGNSPRAFKAIEKLVFAISKVHPEDTPDEKFQTAKELIYDAARSQETGKNSFVESLVSRKGARPNEGAQPERANPERATAGAIEGGGGPGVGQGTSRTEVEAAAAETDPNPTKKEIENDSYHKGQFEWNGLDIAVENPKGSIRKDKETGGKKWAVRMAAHYGEVLGTEGRDGDPVDVYIGDHPESDTVWVVDQVNPATKKFDEHKGLIGFTSKEEAIKAYDSGFSDGSGPSRRGAVTEMSRQDFVDWVNEGGGENGALAYGKKARELVRFSIRGKGRKADLMRDLEDELRASKQVEDVNRPIDGPGWITPQGDFVEAEASSPLQMQGLELGGHEKAALDYIKAKRPELYPAADKAAEQGISELYKFMHAHGFVRVAGDSTQLMVEGRPSTTQIKLLMDSAMLNRTQLIHDLGSGRSRTLYEPGDETRWSKRAPNSAISTDQKIAEMFSAAIDSLRTQGVDVRVLRSLQEGGVHSPRQIVLAIGDATHPTADNLVLAMHEAGHEAFSRLGLPPFVQEAFHQAIAKLATPEGFEPVLAKGADASVVRPEEVLVERAARALVEQGFNPAEARSIADRLLRYVKRIYLRAAMAIQRGLLGDGHVNPEVAQRYFEERLKSFLAGDNAMSMLSFLGGPRLSTGQERETFGGLHGAVAAVFDPDLGAMGYKAVPGETMAAIRFNSATAKFSVRSGLADVHVADPHVISRDTNSPDKVSEDIAAYNALHDIHQTAFKAFESKNPGKMTFEQFLAAFTNADTPATEKVKARNEELVQNGFGAVDPNPRPEDLKSEASQMQAADKALRYAWSMREWMGNTARDAERFLRTAEDKKTRLTARVSELMRNYTDMDLHLATTRDELKDLHSGFKDDFNAAAGSAHKVGALTQVLAHIDQRASDPIALAKQYEPVINRLYSQLTKDRSGQFLDILRQISETGVDWRTIPTKDAITLVTKMIAPTDPSLKQLENRGLAAIAVAFGKENYHQMELLRLTRDSAFEDRQKLNDILKKAMESGADAIPRARELARKLPKLAVSADRLLTRLEELKAENYAHLDAMHRAKVFSDFYRDALPAMRVQMAHLEQMIGAKLQTWEPNNGVEYYAAPAPGASEEAVMGNTRILKLAGVEGNEDIIRHIQQNKAWLESVPKEERGAFWNTVNEMTEKLTETAAFAGHELVIKNGVLNYLTGSIVDKLDSLGLPTARAAAQRFRRYLAEKHAAAADADVKGGAWRAAEAKAMDALGLKAMGLDKFERVFFQGALSFAEKNSDLRALHKGNKEAFEALLPRLKRYLQGDKNIADALERPGAWNALEQYYRRSYENMEWVNALRQKLVVKILEEGPNGFKIEREPVGSTFYTALRRISGDAVRMYHGMREAGWLGTETDGRFEHNQVSQQYETDPHTLATRVGRRFTHDVWREFVQPLTEMEGRAAFHGPKLMDGMEQVALRENVARAAREAEQNPIQFAERLYDLETTGKDVAETRGEFVGKTLEAFQEFFDTVHETQKDYDDKVQRGIPTPTRLLEDARISESWPGQWLQYQTMGRYELHEMADQLSSRAAFGRDLMGMRQDLQSTVRELERKVMLFEGIKRKVTDANPGMTGRKLQDAIRREVEAQGHSYTVLSQAYRNLQMAKNESSQFENLIKAKGGLAMELRPYMELLNATVGATVQGPGTALVHFGNFGQQFQKLGLGGVAMGVLRKSLGSMASENVGTLAQLFHTQIGWNAELNARRMRNGLYDPDARRKFMDTVAGFANDPVAATNPISAGTFRLARAVRAVISSGIGKAPEGSETAYVTLKPHALFTQLAQHMNAAFVDGWTSAFEDMVERAVDYFKDPAHAGHATDPAFQFEKLTDLGYHKGFLGIGSDERAFKYLYTTLAKYGMNVEQMARDLAKRREVDPHASALTDDQFRRLAAVVQNEVTLDGSPANRPSALYTNPALRMASPLLGWSIAKTHDNWEAWRNPDMSQTSQNAFKAFAAGLLPYLALVPTGVALGYLRNAYNDKVLGKKANREDATSFAGMVDSLSWVGTLGLAGDVYNSMLNRDTQRPFDLDNRVFVMSSMINAKRALQNWYEQGTVDYSTVYRPLLQALGGSGYLQYAQILNHAMSLDNSESRVTARINASNILRVAGRETKMDVRVSGGGDSISTPIRPHIGQMVMAAYANDAVGFREAYMKAMEQAREMKEPDPQKYVAQKFQGYNPLRSVFRTEPSLTEVQRMMAVMSDDNRESVKNALRLYNAYASQLGLKEDFGRAPKAQALLPEMKLPVVDLAEARRRAAGY